MPSPTGVFVLSGTAIFAAIAAGVGAGLGSLYIEICSHAPLMEA